MVRINGIRYMPLHEAAYEFRRYGGKRAEPAGQEGTAESSLAKRTMQGAITPKTGRACKRIKSFERGVSLAFEPLAPCRGQSSHGARRRNRRAAPIHLLRHEVYATPQGTWTVRGAA